MTDVSPILKRIMSRQKISQRAIADRLGISHATFFKILQRWRAGGPVRVANLTYKALKSFKN